MRILKFSRVVGTVSHFETSFSFIWRFEKVATEMNNYFQPKHQRKESILKERRILVTPSVKHKLSQFQRLEATRKHFCFLYLPSTGAFYKRRCTCVSCTAFKTGEFLKCERQQRCGPWVREAFRKKMKCHTSCFYHWNAQFCYSVLCFNYSTSMAKTF